MSCAIVRLRSGTYRFKMHAILQSFALWFAMCVLSQNPYFLFFWVPSVLTQE